MILSLLAGVLVGALIVVLLSRLQKSAILAEARSEAQQLLADANERAEVIREEIELITEEIQDTINKRAEPELEAASGRIQKLDDKTRARRSQIDRDYNSDRREIDDQIHKLTQVESGLKKKQDRLQSIKKNQTELRQLLLKKLQEVSQIELQLLKEQILAKVVEDSQIESAKKAQNFEEEIKLDSEEIAQKILLNVLNRFQRPAPTERGLGIVEIPNPEVKKRMLGDDEANLRKLESLTGVGLSVTEKNTFQLASFDPVAREITTRTLEKLLHERAPTADTVQKLFEKTTGEVTRRVENDGNRIAAELGCRDLHPEIKKRLGQLRYRYSFAQNQHYHVAEVGWLCGLLASELRGVRRELAQRAGLLHDVGKAMDHAMDGGHAVIGAEFIEGLGEGPDVVHAVRAHHYEEQPHSDLCYLVIAADAISGARPGARRATVSSYNQKIEVLSSIADGIPGVIRTLIFNAGREVRVFADSRRISDKKALELCQKIAEKIEHECQYPGQIKVVVVRETVAEALAR